jgi:hypothetical protein
MSNAKNSRITLELEAGADPIRGSIEHPDGSCHPFWGWLELMEEVRRVTTDERKRPARPTRLTHGRDSSPMRESSD